MFTLFHQSSQSSFEQSSKNLWENFNNNFGKLWPQRYRMVSLCLDILKIHVSTSLWKVVKSLYSSYKIYCLMCHLQRKSKIKTKVITLTENANNIMTSQWEFKANTWGKSDDQVLVLHLIGWEVVHVFSLHVAMKAKLKQCRLFQ